MKQEIFDEIRNAVCSICNQLGYTWIFSFSSFSFKVYSRFNKCGQVSITDNLLRSVSSVPNVVFDSVGVDDNGLYALFYVSI